MLNVKPWLRVTPHARQIQPALAEVKHVPRFAIGTRATMTNDLFEHLHFLSDTRTTISSSSERRSIRAAICFWYSSTNRLDLFDVLLRRMCAETDIMFEINPLLDLNDVERDLSSSSREQHSLGPTAAKCRKVHRLHSTWTRLDFG